MKKKISFLFWFSLVALLSFGQVKSKKVTILWGAEQKESKKSTLSDIVGYDKTGFYAIKREKKVLTIEHFNMQMNKTKSIELNLEEQNKEKEFEFIINLNKKLYLFSSFRNQKLKKNFLFMQTIDNKSLLLNKDLKMIAEIDYSENSRYNSGSYSYELSRDSSRVLIYYNLPYNKGESEKFGFHVFDNNFNQVWEKNVVLPYKDELFEIQDYKVDDTGNVYLLGVIFKGKRVERRKGEPNYKYQILSYTGNGSEMREYPVEIPGTFLTDMQIAINDDQDIICGGFYSAEGTFSIKGSYFLKINSETKEILTKEFKEFGIDFITQNMTEKKEEKAKKRAESGKDIELYQYDLKDIILRDDGGAVLIGEQFYVVTTTVKMSNGNGGTTTSSTSQYFYNDIIVISISPDGSIDWNEKIPKKQVTVNDGGFYSSFAVSVVKDKLYFVFNDHPNNLFYKKQGKLSNFNKGPDSVMVLVELDSQGNQTREALYNAKKSGILTRPKVCEQISDNEMILFGQDNKIHRFARLTFKN